MSQSSESKRRILLENLADTADVLRAWVTQSWRIGLLMMKGAYLLSERRRLFTQLGEEVFFKIERGEFQNRDLEPMVKQLQRLTKKVELEEMQIRSVRFGKRNETRESPPVEETQGNP